MKYMVYKKYKVCLMKTIETLGIVGSANWILVGLLKYDVVVRLFGYGLVTDIIYVLAGASGVFVVGKALLKK
jgi:uncharacterized membrane protein YuzA (DUF378 family)